MRLPEGFSDDVLSKADIVRIISDYVPLKKKGKEYTACCPFHQEKTASFTVSESKQFFKCFGCGAGGDLYEFLMRHQSIPFPEAVRLVADKVGVTVPTGPGDSPDEARSSVLELNALAAQFFAAQLDRPEAQPARDYIARRGLSPETVKLFRIGYAPNAWEALITYLRSRGASDDQITKSGLVSTKDDGRFYDKFRGRLMFPVLTLSGDVVAFSGRVIGEGEPKYLNSPETPAYTKGHHLYGLSQAREAIRRLGFAVMVEGNLDAVMPSQAGVVNIVAPLGTAITEAQVKLLRRFTRRCLINFDPDKAGQAATRKAINLLLGEGFEVKVITLPEGQDPDQFIREHGLAAYHQAMKTAPDWFEYLINQALSQIREAPAQALSIFGELIPYLKYFQDPAERGRQTSLLLNRLNLQRRK